MGKRLVHHLETIPSPRLFVYMVFIFGFSLAMYRAAGVRFDDSPLPWFWQFLDPELLRHRLLESLFYLHSQPPAFNLFLGLVLKLFGDHAVLVFQGVYLAGGLLLYLAMFLLMRRMGVSRVIALAVSTLFMVSPSFVLYEHWLFYTFLLAVLLALSGVFWVAFLNQGRYGTAIAFFATLFLLCAMRSLFHLFYFVLVAGVLVVVYPPARKKTLLVASVPFVLLFLLYLKNHLLFGTFGTSTWLGMNFANVVLQNVPAEKIEEMVREGKLSPLVLIEPFSDPEKYPPEYFQVPGWENVPALRAVRKSTGEPNYNHLAYIALARQYSQDARTVVKQYPRAFLEGVVKAFLTYFKPSSDYEKFLGKNRSHVSRMDNLINTLMLPVPPRHGKYYVCLVLVLGIPLGVGYGLWLGLKANAAARLDRNQRLLILFLCFNIVYVMLVGNLFEVGENNRFRFMTDPLSAALLGVLIQHVLRRLYENASNEHVLPA